MYDSDEEKRLPMFHLLLTQQLVKRVSMSSVQEELEGEDLDLNDVERRQVLRARAKSSTPAEWKKAGLRFVERGLFDAAVKCFEKSGDGDLLHSARGQDILAHVLPDAMNRGCTTEEQTELIMQAAYELVSREGTYPIIHNTVHTCMHAHSSLILMRY